MGLAKNVCFLDSCLLAVFWVFMVFSPKAWLNMSGIDVSDLTSKESMLMLGLVQALGLVAAMTSGVVSAAAKRGEKTQKNVCAAYSLGLLLQMVVTFVNWFLTPNTMSTSALYSFMGLGAVLAVLNGVAGQGCEFRRSEAMINPLYLCQVPWLLFLASSVVGYGLFFTSAMQAYQLELSDRATDLMTLLVRNSFVGQYINLLCLLGAAFMSSDPVYMHVISFFFGGGGLSLFYVNAAYLQWWHNYVATMPSMFISLGWVNAVSGLVLGAVSFYPSALVDNHLERAISERLKEFDPSYSGLTQQP